ARCAHQRLPWAPERRAPSVPPSSCEIRRDSELSGRDGTGRQVPASDCPFQKPALGSGGERESPHRWRTRPTRLTQISGAFQAYLDRRTPPASCQSHTQSHNSLALEAPFLFKELGPFPRSAPFASRTSAKLRAVAVDMLDRVYVSPSDLVRGHAQNC